MLLIADNGEAYHPENAEKMRSFMAENCLKRGFLPTKNDFCDGEKLWVNEQIEGLNGAKCRCNT